MTAPRDILDTTTPAITSQEKVLKHGEIARRYSNKNKDRGRPFSLSKRRLDDLTRLYQHRYGDNLPDNKEGRDLAFVMVNHLGEPELIRRWIEKSAPWLNDDDSADDLVKGVKSGSDTDGSPRH